MSKKLFAALSLSLLLGACQGSVTAPAPTDGSNTVSSDGAMMDVTSSDSGAMMDATSSDSGAMMDVTSSTAAMDNTTAPAAAADANAMAQ